MQYGNNMKEIATYLEFSGYTVFIFLSLATLSMVVVNVFRSKKYEVGILRSLCMSLAIVAGCYFGSKLLYILEELTPDGSRDFGGWSSGFSMFGSFLLFPVAIALVAKISKYPVAKMFDYATPGLLILLGVQRMGCFFAGCCGGPALHLGQSFVWTFPVQLEEVILDFCICFLILYLEKKERFLGRLLLIAQVIYGIGRFILEFFRWTPKTWFGMSHGQVFALILVGVSVLIFILSGKKAKSIRA